MELTTMGAGDASHGALAGEQGEMTTKAELNALEKVFAAEIDGRLPFQSKAKIFSRLCEEGHLEPMQRKYGSGWSAITVSGYQLTHLGRLTYCMSCPDEPTDNGSVT